MSAVGLSQLLIFTKQFAAMTRSNLHLVDVLDSLAKETPQKVLRDTIRDVVDKVKTGFDLSEVMKDHPKVFDQVYVSVVRSGMESGQLSSALEQVAAHLERISRVQTKLRSAAIYPAILGLSLIVIFNLMVFMILPRFERIFSSFGKELPFVTQVMLQIGDVYASNWLLIFSSVAAIVFSCVAWRSNKNGRVVWDRLMLKLPILGQVLRLSAVARFAHTLSVQVANSVPMLDALRLAAPAAGNRYIEEVVLQVGLDIERGSGVSEAFRKHDLFSGVVQQMAASGEESGHIDEMLMSVAGYFDSLWFQRIETLTSLFNPLMTAIVGFFIALMMIASFLPVFDISGVTMG